MGRMGCASCMVWRAAFLGRQTLMPSRSERASAGAIDLRLTITLAVRFGCYGLAVIGIIATLLIAFGG